MSLSVRVGSVHWLARLVLHVILVAPPEDRTGIDAQEISIQGSGDIHHNSRIHDLLTVRYCCARLMKQIVLDLKMATGSRAILISIRASSGQPSTCATPDTIEHAILTRICSQSTLYPRLTWHMY
jgi:hypothetical protein